jgi:hypothetical protein
MRTMEWIRAAPRPVVLVIGIAVTWGMWLAHVKGVNVERSRWEKYRRQVTEIMRDTTTREDCMPMVRQPPRAARPEV